MCWVLLAESSRHCQTVGPVGPNRTYKWTGKTFWNSVLRGSFQRFTGMQVSYLIYTLVMSVHVTLPCWNSMDCPQMAGDASTQNYENFGVPWTAIRWQETQYTDLRGRLISTTKFECDNTALICCYATLSVYGIKCEWKPRPASPNCHV
jgi:hypothetical protein